jgi:hypothetical protein
MNAENNNVKFTKSIRVGKNSRDTSSDILRDDVKEGFKNMHELSQAMLTNGDKEDSDKGTMMMINEGTSGFHKHASTITADRYSSKVEDPIKKSLKSLNLT